MDGQNVTVDLNSGMEVASNDMLVNVNAPKFLHNRQKMQGRYMPSSVRYEHDGYAIDKQVWEFLLTEGIVKSSPEKYFINKRVVNNLVPIYRYYIKDENKNTVATFEYTPEDEKFENGKLHLEVSSTISVDVQIVDGEWRIVDVIKENESEVADLNLTVTGPDSKHQYDVEVVNQSKSENGTTLKFAKGKDFIFGSNNLLLTKKDEQATYYENFTIKVKVVGNDVAKIEEIQTGKNILALSAPAGKVGILDSAKVEGVLTEGEYVTSIAGISSSDASQLINTQADTNVTGANSISWTLSTEENSSGEWKTCRKNDGILAYDDDEHRTRVRIDTTVPLWAGIIAHQGLNQRDVEGETPADVTVKMLDLPQGKNKGTHPTVSIAAGPLNEEYILHNYITSVYLPNVDIMEQDFNISEDGEQTKYSITATAGLRLRITGTYQVVDTYTGWEEDFADYLKMKKAFPDAEGILWDTYKEEKDSESEHGSGVQYVTHYQYRTLVPSTKSFDTSIDFSKWYNPMESLAKLLPLLRNRIVVNNSGAITSGTDYNGDCESYNPVQEGTVLADTFTYNLAFMMGGKAFSDSSYVPLTIVPSSTAWLSRITSDRNNLGNRDYAIARYTVDINGSINFVLTNGKTSPAFAGGKAFFLMPGVFSTYLYAKKPFSAVLKDMLEGEDFEVEETEPPTANTKVRLTGENRKFALKIKSYDDTMGFSLAVTSVTDEPDYLYYVKMSTTSETPRRFWTDNLNGFFPPYKGVTNNSMMKVGIPKGVGNAATLTLDVSLDNKQVNKKNYIKSGTLAVEPLTVLESLKCNALNHFNAIRNLGYTQKSITTETNMKTGKTTSLQVGEFYNEDSDVPFRYVIEYDGKNKSAYVDPTEVIGEKDFDVQYRVNEDLSVTLLYTAYFDKQIPQDSVVSRKEGESYRRLPTYYADDILYAEDNGRRYGFKEETGEVFLQFDTSLSLDDLKNRKVNISNYSLRKDGEATEVIISTQEKVRVTGITISAVYEKNGVDSATINDNVLTFVIDGITYTVSLATFENSQNKTYLEYFYTDVEDENDQRVLVGKQDLNKEYQFLKQQWNTTVEVENFWWVDSTHILVLTKSALILRRKTEQVDDWAGDKWEDEKTYRRSDYLDSSVVNYFATSVKGDVAERQGALFVTVQKGSGNTILFSMYSPKDNMSKVTFSVKLVKKDIGKELNANKTKDFNSYSTLIVSNVISQAKWSATAIENIVIIGMHYNNNFDQWTVFVNRFGKVQTVVQGYGFVGADGLLTGGEIPRDYLSNYTDSGYIGFNTKVEDIKILGNTGKDDKKYVSAGDLNTITEKVVGTATQQWYIKAKVSDIVSHIKVAVSGEKLTFTPEYLPITNNYSAVYGSGSFTSTILADYTPQFRSLIEFITNTKNSGWGKMVNMLASPTIPYFDAKLSTFVYLQQTLGQAAYVHYNSTSIHQSKDMNSDSLLQNRIDDGATAQALEQPLPVSRDEVSFDYQSIRQSDSASKRGSVYKNMFMLCGSAMVSADRVANEKLKVNEESDVRVIDLGTPEQLVSSHAKFFAENVAGAALAEIRGLDMNPSLNSEVTGVKTLDMFYSTCDEQKISAGKGWVNHNLQAQCTVQSVTSLNMTGRQQRFFWLVKSGATLEARLALAAAERLVAATESVVTSTNGGLQIGVFGGLAGGGTDTNAAEVGTHYGAMAAYLAALTVKATAEITYNIVEAIVDALGGDHLQSSITHVNTAHNINPEATHKYGTKTECFMYPCWDCKGNTYVDETAETGLRDKAWELDMHTHTEEAKKSYTGDSENVTHRQDKDVKEELAGKVHYYIAAVKGTTAKRPLPSGMASVVGVESFLDNDYFKNENVGESEPVFTTPPFQDYIIDEDWELGRTASVGMTTWISCKDTKLIDGEESNVCITEEFCGVASPYAAIEIRRGIDQKYIRPFAITPKVLGLNHTGYNCVFEKKMYHAFDGYGYRLVDWAGEKGMAKGGRTFQYSFLTNDRFKRSNKMPHNTFFGNFKCDPTIALAGTAEDKVFSLVTAPEDNRGLTSGTIGEDKDVRRYSLPVFTEYVSTMPAIVKTISSYNLSVIDGITTLTAENHDLQSAYKAPLSVDFAIGEYKFRYTEEYICTLNQSQGVTVVEHQVPCLGLTFLGATPNEALFYNKDNKQYYSYSGGKNLQLVDMIERFRNVITGKYDFIGREIIVPALATFKRLDDNVEDGYSDENKETDNIVVLRMNGREILGEIAPPLRTIFTTREGEDIRRWFRVLSLPMGVTYQGPNRCIVNRYVVSDYMLKGIRDNYGKWSRVPREKYHPFRKYKKYFSTVTESIGDDVLVKGWTHNPFLLVTAPLGVGDEADCMFEWNITFCWTREMDMLYNKKEYAVVNIMAETMTAGGKVISERPVHVFLVKELFTRTGNYGYYSFRFQSNCGAGNRERLHLWSDQYIAISSLTLVYKQVTGRHNDILTQQVDVKELQEI